MHSRYAAVQCRVEPPPAWAMQSALSSWQVLAQNGSDANADAPKPMPNSKAAVASTRKPVALVITADFIVFPSLVNG